MTKEQKDSVLAFVRAAQVLAEAIREAKEIPSGHLYAICAGVVERESSHLLRWIGPDKTV